MYIISSSTEYLLIASSAYRGYQTRCVDVTVANEGFVGL
jgi:hypothetical protein